MSPRIGCVVQARMGSTRLPGKSMLPLAGEPLIYRVLQRILRCTVFDEIVLAIPDSSSDQILAIQAARLDVPVIYGSEANVADRFRLAITRFNFDVVARIPADNYLTEAWAVKLMIAEHLRFRSGFSTNIMAVEGSGFPDGIGCEVFEGEEFLQLHGPRCTPETDEHVHRHYFNYSETESHKVRDGFVRTIECPSKFSYPDLRFDVNTYDDYERASTIYEHFRDSVDSFGLSDIVASETLRLLGIT